MSSPPATPRPPFWNRPAVVVVAITALAALLRTVHLDYKCLWLDEALCYWVSHGSLEEIINNNRGIRATPPLFTLIISLLLRLGDSEALLRTIPALAGIAVVPAMYWLARHWLSTHAAYLAALFAALSQSQVMLSQQLREYTPAMLAAVLIIGFYYRCLRDPTWKNWIALCLLWLLGLSLQYGLWLLIGTMNIVFLIEALRSSQPRLLIARWAVANLPVLVLAIVAFARLEIDRLLYAGGPGVDLYLKDAYWQGSLWSLGRLATTNTLGILRFAYPTPTLLLVLVCAGVVSVWREDRSRMAVLALLLPTACTFLTACLGLHPYHGARHSFFLTPMIYVMAAGGAVFCARRIQSRALTTSVLVILAIIGLKSSVGELTSKGLHYIRPVVETLSESIKESDRVFVHHKALPAFRYYYRRDPCWASYREHVGSWIYRFTDYDEPARDLKQLDEVLATSDRVWMVLIAHLDHRELLTQRAATTHKVELVAASEDMWLYLAHKH